MTENNVQNTDHLKRKLLKLSALVEESARRCVLSIRGRDHHAAQQVIDTDQEIDALEIRIEEDCVSLLQNAALDHNAVRFIVAVLRINSDLERIGDLASNVSRRVLELGQHEQLVLPNQLMELAEKTISMLTACLDSLVHLDTDMARKVCTMDQDVDALNQAMYGLVRDRIVENPAQTERLLHMLGVSRSLERMADFATNIAENVVYIDEGRIIRHGMEDEQKEVSA
jgi:phosphate transport system protein